MDALVAHNRRMASGPTTQRRAVRVRSALVYATQAVFAITAVYCVFGLLLSHFIEYSRFGRWDNAINRALAQRRSAWLDDLTGLGTRVVDTASVFVITAVTELVLVLRRLWRFAIAIPVALASELAIFVATNEITRRPRPSVSKLGSVPKTFSFPSGHTAAAVVLFGIIALALGEHHPPFLRRLAYTTAGILVVVVGFSRVYRGMHHVTDVVGGAAMGWAAVVVGFGAAAVAHPNAHRDQEHPAVSSRLQSRTPKT